MQGISKVHFIPPIPKREQRVGIFGRDTVEILVALNRLRTLGVRVIFEQEELDTAMIRKVI